MRDDLAASHLKGKLEAPRFADGMLRAVVIGTAALRGKPSSYAGLDTELLCGERFTVYDEKDGWAWGQSGADCYVGYVQSPALGEPGPPPTHRVTALRTPIFPAADLKRPPIDFLPMNAKIAVLGQEGKYARIAQGHVPATHIAPAASWAADWVAIAERFLGVPYLWGGKTATGLDCSGLIQTALEAAGIAAPRDTDMMEAGLGQAIEPGAKLSGLTRGDLVFWRGHMGVMLDGVRLLHANAFHMEVAIEPVGGAVARIRNVEGDPRAFKRLQ